MSDTINLIQFTAGTKAKASEVNSNFSTLKTAIESKSDGNGDSTKTFSVANATENSHAINKSQLNALETSLQTNINKKEMPFCIKSGNLSNGIEDILSYNLLEMVPKVGGTYANLITSHPNGELIERSSLNSIDMTGKADGIYNVFIPNSGNAYVLLNTIYRTKTAPSTPALNSIWVDISKEPLSVYKHNGTEWETFNDVPIGSITIASGNITAVKNLPFNYNGLGRKLYDSYKNGTSWYNDFLQVNPENNKIEHWIEQGGIINSGTIFTLLKPFKDINYTISLSFDGNHATAQPRYRQIGYHSKTETTISGTEDSGASIAFIACGYGN